MPVPIAGLLSGATKIVGATRSRGSGTKLAGSIVKREPKKAEENSAQESKSSSALAIRPKQSLVPYQNIESVPPTDGMNAGDKVIIIHKKIIEIDNLLKGTLAADKNLIDQRNRQEELEEERKREEKLEKKDDKEKKPDKNKLNQPKMGIFGAVGNFITNVVLGFILTRLVDHAPKLEGIIKGIASVIEWTSNFVIGFVDGLGSFLIAGLRAYQWAENYLQKNSGEEAVERFHGLTKQLTNLFNAFLIVGSVFAALGRNPLTGKSPGAKKKLLEKASRLKAQKRLVSKEAIERYTKRFGADAAKKKFGSAGQAAANRLGLGKSQVIKGGLGRSTTRIVGKTLGPKAMKAIGPIIKKLGAGFSRVPIVGSLIVAVSSLLAGEPLGQAAFKGLGAALGGFAGSFIPIPVVGTLIGSTIGTFIGDVLYTLILEKDPKAAGEKFMKGLTDSIKMLFDFVGMAAQFVKEGFGRLIKNFPTIDVPPILGLQSALGKVAGLFGIKDDSKFMEDGRIVKLPNLALLTPMGLPFLVPHIAKSFLPDIFGKNGVVSSIFGKNGTAWGGSGESIGDPQTRSAGEGGSGFPPVNMETAQDTGNQSEGSKIAGKLGRFLNERSLRWGSGVTEHPEHGGVTSPHATNSYHYAGRAIDIGGWGPNRYSREGMSGVDDQTKIIQGIREFNNQHGVRPVEFLHEGNEPYGHNDHVHIAYQRGGFTKGMAHKAILGEVGPEFVIDTDSAMAIEGRFPGLLDAINSAKGKKSIEVLESYASYDDPKNRVIVIEGEPEEPSLPAVAQRSMNRSIFAARESHNDFTEFLVGQG